MVQRNSVYFAVLLDSCSPMMKRHRPVNKRRTDEALQRRLLQTIRMQRSEFVTLVLLGSIMALAIGLVLRLPPPDRPQPPAFFTPVAYSTAIALIRTGHVRAANLQEDALDALLFPRRGERSGADATFGACLPLDPSGCLDENGLPLFPRTRVIYTLAPERVLPSVLALLLSKRAVVVIARMYVPPAWVPLLWKVAPLWIAFLLILGMETPKRRTW